MLESKLVVHPASELVFNDENAKAPKNRTSTLALSNPLDEPIHFKIKTTNPKRYSVRPNAGVVLPQSTVEVIVSLLAQTEPIEEKVKDMFEVHSLVGDAGDDTMWENKELVARNRLTVSLIAVQQEQAVSAATAPKPRMEGTDGAKPTQLGDAALQAIAEALQLNTLLALVYPDNQEAPLHIEIGKAAAYAAALAAIEIQQLRAELAAKEQELQRLCPELAAKEQELQRLCPDLAANEQELQRLCPDLAAKDGQIDKSECNQPAGTSARFDDAFRQLVLATLAAGTSNGATESLLGEGAFGRMKGATGPRVDSVQRWQREGRQRAATVASELLSLSKVSHPNIIATMSYVESGDEWCFVNACMPKNGSVRDRLDRKTSTPPLTWFQRHRIAADVARGMHHIQTAFPDRALIHLDLTTDHVLLDEHFTARVSDSGLIRAAHKTFEGSYVCTQDTQGALAYLCPELLIEGRMTIKTDVYAFGMILLELLTAAKAGPSLKTSTRKAVKNNTVFEMLDSTLEPTEAERQSGSELATLALACLEEAADDRPSFESILATLDP
ncbi:hypothetical protein CAOG_02782 [Capsaspora owczarzaki ATCC 30864]|uniref:TKL/IRAK protein kinase, variant 1 n=1 Tax=Capsaspora owczarzaki (strain ATCC 30864) TaxID=595528 RepID=A0A0D2X1Z7_CAPO3|nr:hypothetical protein CAOG_02782 [Capsaspora owczarzaki ATCC 30864]KJE91679.1 TKL/IRAK protein kinase, variant 1 [Capsaspora owczarzaki ATCC 30864]|eukprot:XP_004349535.1 hypothetical protein CAOG_02782 [Capsaspora owczarzaki ATCC 30864]